MSSSCNSCGAPILWVETEAKEAKDGKAAKPSRMMPLDADPENPGYALQTAEGNIVFTGATSPKGNRVVRYVPASRGRHIAHFASCPNAAQHRKRK